MSDKEKDMITEAIGRAIAAIEAQGAAFLAGDMAEFHHQHAEYNKYCDLFVHGMGISEEQFISLIVQFRECQSKSENIRVNQSLSEQIQKN